MNSLKPIITLLIITFIFAPNNEGFASFLDSGKAASVAAGITVTITYTPDNLCSPDGDGEIIISAVGSSGSYEYSIDEGVTWVQTNTFSGLTSGYYHIMVRDQNLACTDDFGAYYLGCSEGRILQYGDAVYACIPTLPDEITLAVDRIQGFNDFYQAGTVFTDVSPLIQAKAISWTESDLGGSVFSVAIDDDYNLYTGVTSLYDLITDVASADLIKIDAVTGAPAVIATLPGNHGIAAVEYNADCNQVYATNLEDGKIYRYSTAGGAALSVYDPMGLDDGVDGLAPLGERLTAMSYNPVDGKLYYAVWANDRVNNGSRNLIRSVSIDPVTCDFIAGTDQIEVTMPFLSDTENSTQDFSHPVLDIEFDPTGTILLASESGFDSTVPLKIPHEARLLRFNGASGAWMIDNAPPVGNTDYKYQIGTISDGTNALGGVDFGYAGIGGTGCTQDPGSFVVATGDALKGISCSTTGCIYGLQYMPVEGGNPMNSVLMDLARDSGSQQKGFYGDVDVVTGCCPCSCPVISFDLDHDMICEGVEVEICATAPAGGIPPYDYDWSNGETTACVTVTPADASTVFAVTVTDDGGCTASESVGTSPDCEYDLSITQTLITMGPFLPGDMVTFEITVTNEGDIPSSMLQFTNTVPATLVFSSDNSATLTDVAFVSSGIYQVNNLGPGESETMQITYTIANTATGTMMSIAEITQDDGDDIDSDPDVDSTMDDLDDNVADDDEDIDPVSVPTNYDLALDQTLMTMGPFLPGDMVTFDVEITNEGDLPSFVMQFSTFPQTGLTFFSDNSMMLAEISLVSPGVYEVTNLAPGDTENLQITYTIDSGVLGNLTHTSVITMDDGVDEDSDPAVDETMDDLLDGNPDDDEDSDIVSTPSDYDLALDLELVTPGPFAEGGTAIFEVTVENQGDVPSTSMEFTINVPPGLTFVGDDSGSQAEITLVSPGVYSVTNLGPGDTETLELEFTVDVGAMGVLTTLAQITSDDGDDDDSDPDQDESTDDLNDGMTDDDEDEEPLEIRDPNEGKIGDLVWVDINGNGVQDTGEPGIEGVKVELRDVNGNLLQVTYTDMNGNYLFDELYPTEYFVQFIYDEKYDNTVLQASGNDDTDSDVGHENGLGTTRTILLDISEENLSLDLGLHECAEISGIIWFDSFANDVMDPSENGINNVRVELLRKVGSIYIVVEETYTGKKEGTSSIDGFYHFCVDPGEYYLRFSPDNAALMQVEANVGTDDTVDSEVTNVNGQNTTNSFVVLSRDEAENLNGGYTASGTIGDFVWFDENGNGIRDNDENGLSDVRVEIFNMEEQMITAVTTDENGNFRAALPPSDYFLQFIFPVGFTPTMPNEGSDEMMDSDIDDTYGPNTTAKYEVNAGEHTEGVGAGVILAVLPVDWLNVEGENINSSNVIKWTVGSETNVSHYEIQIANETREKYVTVGSIESEISNTIGEVSYSYNDRYYPSNLNYYRIKQFDLDGRYGYSDVVAIDNRDAKLNSQTRLSIYPNPSSGEINIEVELYRNTKELQINVIDQLGKVVLRNLVIDLDLDKGFKHYISDLTKLDNGMYTLELKVDNEIIVKKILITD